MSSKTFKAHALVLKKTKLGEKDVIVTMLDESGMLLKGVAKGARKPGGSFAARLESFSEVEVLMAEGRSLDVVCDAKLRKGALQAGNDGAVEKAACAAPIAELAGNIAQPDLEQPRIFDMVGAAFDRIFRESTSRTAALSISAAGLWKVMSQVGFRPSFARCALCGGPVGGIEDAGQVALSLADGGIVCDDCMRPPDAFLVDANTVRWCDSLIRMRYDEVALTDIDAGTCMAVLQLARAWARVHTGRDLKSVDFLLVSGLYA